MDAQSSHMVVSLRPRDMSSEGPLASLVAAPMSGRFCAWRGASGRRYVATVYPADCSCADLGLPDFQSFALLAVARIGTTRRVLEVSVVERSAGRRAAVASGLARGADEWHVHFLPENPNARARTVTDLRARHGCSASEVRCA